MFRVITFPSAKMDFNWPLQTRKIRQSFFRQKSIKGQKGQYFKYRFTRFTKKKNKAKTMTFF